MNRALQPAWKLTKAALRNWWSDGAPRLGAALAFYSVLSLGPLLLIIVSICGLVFGYEAATGQIIAQLHGLVGPDAAKIIQTVLENSRNTETGIFAALAGSATLLLGATGVFGQLQTALNLIWQVEPARGGAGMVRYFRKRFLSFAAVLGTGFLLLTSLAISAALAAAGEYFVDVIPEAFLHACNFLLSFGVVTLLFAMIFKLLPDARIEWRDVWMGAVITALLFTVGKSVIGLYLGHSALSSAYGASGALIVVLLWVYYSAQILFLGAEFTQAYACMHGSSMNCEA